MVATRKLVLVMVAVGVGVSLWVAPTAWARAAASGRVTGDEPQYLITALSLAEDRSLDVADERAELAYTDFHRANLLQQERIRDDGSQVSPHDPLLPVLLAVPMGLGGWFAAKLMLAVLAGVLAALMIWVAVRRFTVPLAVAALTVATFSLAAPLVFYGTQVYPELPAALAVTVAIAALTGPLRAGGLAALGVAVVALPWLSVKYAPVAVSLVAVGLVVLWRRGERRTVGLLVVGLAAAGVVYLVAHQVLYEGWTVYASGRHFPGSETTVIGVAPDYFGRAHRVLGLLTDRGFGLAAWQPAYLLVVPAVVALVRIRPPGWVALALPLVAGWLNASFVARTMHGWWWPGRQLVVVLPAAVLAVAWWASRYARARPWLWAGLGWGALTAAWMTVDSWLGHRRLVVDFEDTVNPLYRLWRLALPDGRLVPAGTGALRALWCVAIALLAVWGWRSLTTQERPPDLEIPEQPNTREAALCVSVPS